ncbi:hypothetical protein CTAYLR_002020 [Chrysophaeum taylorii]|uniref:Methyltransferase type 11 domain-containing protein n=1 Tax=Chrysophaeum taylorii TaxID=2483200 RepID=A0AAD7UP80_9STRA|nr:hypothetical protein CTAYLR_002020 [Chrysophaeum taylorii]
MFVFFVAAFVATPSRRPPPTRLGGVREIARYDSVKNSSSFVFPAAWPYTAADFQRTDDRDDSFFFTNARLVTHIDDKAMNALTAYYRKMLSPGDDILDVCSSWVSHLPKDVELGRKYAVGMNAEELAANKQLTSWVVRDLNKHAELPFNDDTFDAVLNVVGVDYLTNPRDVFKEMYRVLRPGGVAIMAFSHHYWPTKVIRRWIDADMTGRVTIVANYFYFSAPWRQIVALDVAPRRITFSSDPRTWIKALAPHDPIFVVQAVK